MQKCLRVVPGVMEQSESARVEWVGVAVRGFFDLGGGMLKLRLMNGDLGPRGRGRCPWEQPEGEYRR